ncbi:hypothetical protein [Pseudomonas bharatica]|uniref:hypothetical protein n=1 Tax=Pseudomonas bharatica TaxID=2692112 RepID=UPI003B28D0CB
MPPLQQIDALLGVEGLALWQNALLYSAFSSQGREMETVKGKTLLRITKILAFVLCGFAGGTLSPWILGWIKGVSVGSASDAYAIANTYIVFTTIIFVGITVLLAIAGYVITQQFSAAKIAHEMQIIEELKERLATEERLGITLVNAILENREVTQHVRTLLEQKVDALIKERIADSKNQLSRAQDQSSALEDIAAQLFNGGEPK